MDFETINFDDMVNEAATDKSGPVEDVVMDTLANADEVVKGFGTETENGTISVDSDTAAFAAEMWCVTLETSLTSISDSIGIKDVSISKKALKSYEKITKTALESGQIKLPSPSQTFFIATFVLIAMFLFSAWKQNKKNKSTITKPKRDKPIDAEFIDVKPEKMSLESEVNRKNFKVENGFYSFDNDGVYLKKVNRKNAPSDFVSDLIDSGLGTIEIKKRIKEHLKELQENDK